ncbi:hypothetical protein K0M31_014727 [Melipona bicolor]|uniref:Uncharacterized protein n=1 Tax=Melipona bicolor TaxID=60889 RepID=A0AA40FGQ7_9HYME|nr:hypothetical protein K0M31_014727 [Melipona bicolor]
MELEEPESSCKAESRKRIEGSRGYRLRSPFHRASVPSGPVTIGGAISREMEHAARLYSSEVEARPGRLLNSSRSLASWMHAAFCGVVIQRETTIAAAIDQDDIDLAELEEIRFHVYTPRTHAEASDFSQHRNTAVSSSRAYSARSGNHDGIEAILETRRKARVAPAQPLVIRLINIAPDRIPCSEQQPASSNPRFQDGSRNDLEVMNIL